MTFCGRRCRRIVIDDGHIVNFDNHTDDVAYTDNYTNYYDNLNDSVKR